MKSIKNIMGGVIAKCCEKHGLMHHKLITDWQKIVGNELAQHSSPIKLHFTKNSTIRGKLIISILNPGNAMKLQMMSDVIIRSINIYFGYKAVSELRFVVKQLKS